MAALATKSSHGSSATYSFSSQPRPVTATRKKYREPGETDVSMYRDPKETCITWDRRVHRGNTFSMYTQQAIREALEAAERDASPKPVRHRRRVKEPSPFDIPMPEPDRVPVDLTRHLVAEEKPVEVAVVEAQTDEFLPEPPPEQYQPQKTGVDAHTQVEDGELFHFDAEVEPILDVIINKTLEQSIMEVEEEYELSRMSEFKEKWMKRQAAMMAAWQAQVDEEHVQWGLKEELVAQKREEKRREARVLLKVQAMAAAKNHLARLVPNAMKELQEVAFPNTTGLAIDRLFLPQLLGMVQQEVHAIRQATSAVESVVKGMAQERVETQAKAIEVQRVKQRELEKRHLEERQIRQGRIRISVDDGKGGRVPVGPIQISTQDSIDEVQDRVYRWLQEHEPDLAGAWPHGVVMRIAGEPVQAAAQLFEAKAGQISMEPKPPPPPLLEEGGDGQDDDEPGA